MRGVAERVRARIAYAFQMPLRVLSHLKLEQSRVVPTIVINCIYKRTQVKHSLPNPSEHPIEFSNSGGAQNNGQD